MLPELDLPTVLILHKLSFVVAGLCFIYVRSQSRESVGLGLLAIGFFLVAMASILVGVGHLAPGREYVFAMAGMFAGLVGYAVFWLGMCRISRQRKRNREWLVLALPVVICLLLIAAGLYDLPSSRTIAFQTTAAALLFASALTVRADNLTEPLPVRKPLAMSILIAAVLTLLVAVGIAFPVKAMNIARNAFFASIICHFAIAFFVMALVKERTEERLRGLVGLDVLTGVPNRHSFSSRLPEIVRNGDAIVMIDIDHFKRINDTFGHLAGDEILARVARELFTRIRPVDSFARFGGEEFILYQPDIGKDEAVAFSDTLQKVVSSITHVMDDQTVVATLSMGIAVCEEKTSTARSLLKKADMALYASKASGRNRLTLYRAENFVDEQFQQRINYI
ncbi:diguanylate cyclase [Agrobacterium larrymoorei]|uniref:GGDEF domain-containing protein n=1 Tax=Agrobacterium larrymoorei TaxID=160699 RepID=UPI0030C5D258